ncbi:MAG TPA: hypothetical protein VGR51_03365 [Thermoplasmata archaeon]|jgi:predicted dehydrogenase|nr:hypothetical protein [Thermoplasmata archaeon]
MGRARDVAFRREDPYAAECALFENCVRGKAGPTLIAADSAREAVRVAVAARESFARKKPVAL